MPINNSFYQVTREDGRIMAISSDGRNKHVLGQIVVQRFRSPERLVRVGRRVSNLAAADPAPLNPAEFKLPEGVLDAEYGFAQVKPRLDIERSTAKTTLLLINYNNFNHGLPHVIESSLDSKIWAPIFTNYNSDSSVKFEDHSTNAIHQLYRVSSLFVYTGRVLDVAVTGNGYFCLRNPVTGELVASRGDSFGIDNDNFLVTKSGWRLQGHSRTD